MSKKSRGVIPGLFLSNFTRGAAGVVYLFREVQKMDYAQLGKRVRARRKALRITQEQLAELAGVSTAFIGHIERGTRVLSVETLHSLCRVLGVSADFLIGI